MNLIPTACEASIPRSGLDKPVLADHRILLEECHKVHRLEQRIVRTLFPRYLVRVDDNSSEDAEDCPLFTMKDPVEAVFTTENKEAPRPGCYPTANLQASVP